MPKVNSVKKTHNSSMTAYSKCTLRIWRHTAHSTFSWNKRLHRRGARYLGGLHELPEFPSRIRKHRFLRDRCSFSLYGNPPWTSLHCNTIALTTTSYLALNKDILGVSAMLQLRSTKSLVPFTGVGRCQDGQDMSHKQHTFCSV